MIFFRSLFLYLLLTFNVFAIPEGVSICLWNAEIASALQYGRQYENNKNIEYHKNKVHSVLIADNHPQWFILKVLEVFDFVWKEFLITEKQSVIFKKTYNVCIKNYKNREDIFY
tara:strand:+ start:14 stop:355 length:342 start_codon:yes stop_codon:yes gene_type:complete